MSTCDVESTNRPGGLTRRRVLVLGSAGVLAQWLALPARAASLAGLGMRADEPISVGYLDGSEALERLDFLPWEYLPDDWRWRVVPASSLPSGDPSLAVTGVRLTVHGLYPRRPANADLPAFAGLTVLVDSDDPLAERPLVFYPWTLARREALSVGQRVSFVVGVDREDGLPLGLEVREGVQPTAGGRRVAGDSVVGGTLLRSSAFTVGADGFNPRLVRGIYFLALRAGAFDRAVDLPQPGTPGRRDLLSVVVSVEPIAEP